MASLLKIHFSEEIIKNYYFEHVKFKAIPGIDKINGRLFENKLPWFAKTISRKVLNKSYKFTPYKEKLISKGRNKKPRLISIPTIRDKVTLGLLKEYICNSFEAELKHELVQTLIDNIKNTIKSSSYDYFIKLDVENFYGSLDHSLLLKKVRKRIRKKEVINLIESALITPTVTEREPKNQREENKKGVPQGLSISNVLASIYLNSFDKKHTKAENYMYFRYVDDILILCNKTDYELIKNNLIKELKNSYKLDVNESKDDDGEISKGFSYLGYQVIEGYFSVRKTSIRKLEENLEKLFTDFKHSNYKNVDYFIWKLNLRITGCIKDSKKYGWMFFFSQIDDLHLLFHFDWLVTKLIKRFSITKQIQNYKVKKFVKAYKEITLNLHNTRYIPNFDEFTYEQKIDFLKNICGEDINLIFDIDAKFNKVIFSSIKDLEKDIQSFS